MKRFVAVIMAAFLVAGFSMQASAGSINKDVTIGGEYELGYIFEDTDFVDGDDDESSYVEHELDLEFGIDLGKGVMVGGSIEYADSTLGDDDHAIGEDNEIDVEEAYVKMAFEPVNVTAGKFGFAFPDSFCGHPVLDDEATGVDLDFDAASAGWIRTGDFDELTDDKKDIFYVIGNIESGNVTFKPFAAYENQGDDTDNFVDAEDEGFNTYWIGAAFEVDAGNFGLVSEAIYGDRNYSSDLENRAAGDFMDESGFLFDMKAGYKLDNITPFVLSIYSTGRDDADEDGSLPVVQTPGEDRDDCDDYEPFNIVEDQLVEGMFVIGAGIEDISFAPGFEHELILAYMTGTGDKDIVDNTSLNNEDNDAFEIDFNSTYELKKDLADLYLDLGYADADLEGVDDDEAATYVELGLEIEF